MIRGGIWMLAGSALLFLRAAGITTPKPGSGILGDVASILPGFAFLVLGWCIVLVNRRKGGGE